jgi:L-lysine exporter family protein LysE/ArgO
VHWSDPLQNLKIALIDLSRRVNDPLTKGDQGLHALIQGFMTGLSLILAIGAQNAFVLRQGIKREHVAAVVLVCATSDVVLIAAGVGGFGVVTQAVPWLVVAMRWLGVAFLLVYGALRFRSAFLAGETLLPAQGGAVPLPRVIATCLILTWANPHVYLDTMVLLGSISTHFAPMQRWFGIGAAAASFVFFACLGFGARVVAPVFQRTEAWVTLEVIVGLTMWSIAATLALR